jgi:hypothetical protein
MTSVESTVKKQYARFFEQDDWIKLKLVAELYLETAARLQTKHLLTKSLKLLYRNIQKRLFLGISCELLLKSYYLKNGYCINKPKPTRQIQSKFPFKLADVDKNDFKTADTFTLNALIDGLKTVHQFNDHQTVLKGLKTAKVFRNKEGHLAEFWHQFDHQNYKDIAESLRILYKEGFKERLSLTISIARNEKAEFLVKSI